MYLLFGNSVESYSGGSQSSNLSTSQLQKMLREIKIAAKKLGIIEQVSKKIQSNDQMKADQELDSFLDTLSDRNHG